MKPGTIFVSHRAEYAALVRQLKTAIQGTSRGKIKVFISEDIVRGEKWRAAIENHLRESESLFLVYGAPYEDWSWCFYEAGYFAALCREQSAPRDIFCISRPNIPAPGPLNDLQMLTDENQLVEAVLNLCARNGIEHDATAVRRCLGEMTKGLFGKLREFVSYPRVYFMANDADFGPNNLIPPDSHLKLRRKTRYLTIYSA
jgi:hypothetical protein